MRLCIAADATALHGGADETQTDGMFKMLRLFKRRCSIGNASLMLIQRLRTDELNH